MTQRKPTTDEYLERIELVRSMLIRGYPKHTIKAAVRRKYGADLSHVSIEKYFTRAREILAENLGMGGAGKRALRENSLAFYQAVLADGKASARDKIRAQERIDKLMGLEDKSNTPPLEVLLGNLPDALADPIRRLLAERVRGGDGPGGGGANGRAH